MIERAPKLSVGLAVRNGRDCVERCIDSILTQDFAPAASGNGSNGPAKGPVRRLPIT